MKEIKGLTGLRGYAALWVFFLHATWGWPGDSFAMKVARLGGSGVTIFFVLSGFILSYVYAQRFSENNVSYWEFLKARLARVYPLHLVTLATYATLVAYGIIYRMPQDTIYTLIISLGLLHAWGFTDLVSWNEPSWSISVELFAYLLFPFFVARVYRSSMPALVLTTAFVAYWIVAYPYSDLIKWAKHNGLISEGGRQFANGSSLVLFFGVFFAGCVLFCVADRAKRIAHNTVLYDFSTAIGVGLILYWCTFVQGDLTLWQGTAVGCLMVLGISNDSGLSKTVFGNPIAHFFGRISFALYLSAMTVELFAQHFVRPFPLWLNFTLGISVATVLHYSVEIPARKILLGRRLQIESVPTGSGRDNQSSLAQSG